MQPAVFLDRDGTMIRDVGYLSRLEDIEWFPWSIDSIRLLNRAGFAVCVTTNQGGIGMGFYDEAFVRTTHAQLGAAVTAAGGHIHGWYFCPHHPLAIDEALRIDCDCRKPKPGMIRQAEAALGIDVARSFVVGDKQADIGAGISAGAKSILVKTGYGSSELQRHGGEMPGAAFVAETLAEAVSWILESSGYPREAL